MNQPNNYHSVPVRPKTYYQQGVKCGKSVAGAIVGTITGVIGGFIGLFFGPFMNDEELD